VSEASAPGAPPASELLGRINAGWARLQRPLAGLDDAAWQAVPPSGDWSVKDHAGHVAAWERIIVAHLIDGSDHAVVGMEPAAYEYARLEDINARIYERVRSLSVAQVRAEAADAHEALVALVPRLGPQQLGAPYWPADPSGRTVANSIEGNTHLHYAEHREWIAGIAAALERVP
jgi:hypothetical protein